MKRRLLLFGLPIALALIGLSFYSSIASGSPVETASEAGGQQVVVSQVRSAPPAIGVRFSGTLESEASAPVAFTLGGRIDEVYATVGQPVAAGELLARLDAGPFENALSRAEANLARVESSLEQARRSARRVEALGSAATEEELENRRTTVEELEAARREAMAAVAEASRQLEESFLRAPFGGEIVAELADRGEVVQPGTPLYLLSGESEQLEVELSLPEQMLSRIDLASPVSLRFPLSPQIGELNGRVSARTEHASAPGGLFQVTVSLDPGAADRGARPGLRAEVAVPLTVGSERVVIDPAALLSRPDGTPIVFALEGERVREVPLTLHSAVDHEVVVSGALSPGDQIVVAGHRSLLDGESVEVALR